MKTEMERKGEEKDNSQRGRMAILQSLQKGRPR